MRAVAEININYGFRISSCKENNSPYYLIYYYIKINKTKI